MQQKPCIDWSWIWLWILYVCDSFSIDSCTFGGLKMAELTTFAHVLTVAAFVYVQHFPPSTETHVPSRISCLFLPTCFRFQCQWKAAPRPINLSAFGQLRVTKNQAPVVQTFAAGYVYQARSICIKGLHANGFAVGGLGTWIRKIKSLA